MFRAFVKIACVFGVVLALALSATPSFGQQVAVAQVTGRVMDSSNAVVAGATVKMTETEKGISHTATTSELGDFVLPNLPPGPYRLEVSKTGFKTYVQTGITLQVNDHINVNSTLQVGAVSETVEVTEQATMVQTDTTAVSNVVDSQRVVELPLNGRFASQLILLSGAATMYQGQTVTGSVSDIGGSKAFYSSFAVSIAGSQLNGSNYLLDGGDHVDTYSNVNLPFPFPDAIQEFSVETSALPARNGLHPGGVVNVVTKSGTNSFHGDAFEFVRNGAFNARPFFASAADQLHRNQFGGTGGGALKKDKLFYFVGYQGTRISQVGSGSASVPTAAMIAGDFTAYVSNGCGTGVLNPNATSLGASGSSTPYFIVNGTATTNSKGMITGVAAGGSITLNPAYAYNPSSVAFLKYIPAAPAIKPLTASTPNYCGAINYPLGTINNEDQVVGRMDYVLSARHTLYGRYFIDDFNDPPPWDSANLIVTTTPGVFQRAQTITIGDNYSFSPTLLNSLHLTWNRRRDDRGVDPRDINPTAPISSGGLGINMANYVGNFFLISSMNGGFTTGCGTCATGYFNVNTWQIAEDLDMIRGRHHFSFGVDLHRTQNNTLSGYDGNGTFAFNNSLSSPACPAACPGASGITYTGLGMADYLLGNFSAFSFSRPQLVAYRQTIPGLYFQDTFQMTKKLTVIYGLRFEPSLFPEDEFARGATFSLQGFVSGQHSQVYPNAPAGFFYFGDPGVRKAYTANHVLNFAPRLGIAYDPTGSGRQTIRLGGGIFFDSTSVWFAQRMTSDPPYVNEIDNTTFCGTLSNPWLNYQYPPVAGVAECSGATAGANNNPFPYDPAKLTVYPPNTLWVTLPSQWEPTYVAQWDASYDIQFAKDWLVSVTYMGNKTTHATGAFDLNYPQTNYANQSKNPTFCSTFPGGCTTSGTNETARRVLNVMAAANPSLATSAGQIGGLIIADNGGNAHYNAVLASVKHRFDQNFTLLANYTYSRCYDYYDYANDITGPVYTGQITRQYDYGPCGFDIRSMFNTSIVATSPFKRGGWKKDLLADWQIAPTIRAVSGIPVNVTTGNDSGLVGTSGEPSMRPNVVAGISPYLASPTLVTSNPTTSAIGGIQFYNPAAFSEISSGTGVLGSVPRNYLRAPGAINFDLAISRMIPIRERFQLEVRGEAFNLINHWNPTAPGASMNNANTFGIVGPSASASPSPGLIPAQFDPRVLQIAMKLHW